jgi:hypothetical protein
VLRSFARSEMNVVDGLLAGRGGAGLGEESGVPTPAQGLAGLADTEGV